MLPGYKRCGRNTFWTPGSSYAAAAEKANAAINQAMLNLRHIVIASTILHQNSLSHLLLGKFTLDSKLLVNREAGEACFA